MLGRYTTGPCGPRRIANRARRASDRSRYPPPGPMRTIDLRSDTVTKPTAEMRRAMAEAEVGDDVFRDDPTVIALEERAAELLGKEAALFVASGTMANLVAQLAHLARGQEIIAGRQSHVVLDEAAGHAVVAGASVRTIDERSDGTLEPDAVREAFRDPTDEHQPITGLVVIENCHAHSMNQPLTPAYMAEMARIAHAGNGRAPGVPLHVDGARLWNAVVALDVGPRELAAPADSLSFCLSKGLACPAGSLVVGSRELVWRARRARKLLGGGMRQAGILAAAGLVALRDGAGGMIERLADDHANARHLAEALADLDGIESPGDIAQPGSGRLDPARVRTNFVLFRVARNREAFIEAAAAHGVLLDWYPHEQVRAVTHHGIERSDVETAILAIRDALADTALRSASDRHAPATAAS
jgi:threonine aldolase